ncbi:hypothetical protein V2G26_016575 [Clonostachys chloroleuca]
MDDPSGPALHQTACFNCRATRQRCSRQLPCDRCSSHQYTCRYPVRSNRGRKQGSTNKLDTVEKILARIEDLGAEDQIVAALSSKRAARPELGRPSPSVSQQPIESVDSTFCGDLAETRNGQAPLVSPLHVLAATVRAGQNTPHEQRHISSLSANGRLVKYFDPNPTFSRDWNVLAAQAIGSTLKLEPAACDPIAARLVDKDDAAYYFKLFFDIRNPLVGLLDPVLHVPEYVHDMSFTLFSVVCALGCAVSTRARDRLVLSALFSLAESDVKWCVAVSIRSLEAVQAMILLQYWAPAPEKQLDDPYWVYLSYAIQAAREMGIHRPSCRTNLVNLSPSLDEDAQLRLLHNYERTWFNIFIADGCFGINTGRRLRVSWRDIPGQASTWWQYASTAPVDRMISGIVQSRVILLRAIDDRKWQTGCLVSIATWHAHAHRNLDELRQHCTSMLAVYVDHDIMILNIMALRDLLAAGAAPKSPEVLAASHSVLTTATQFLGVLLSDETLLPFRAGFHNNLFIMACHAASEILQAVSRDSQAIGVDAAMDQVQALPAFFESIVQNLPGSSPAHIYSHLARLLAKQMEALNQDRLNDVIFQDGAGLLDPRPYEDSVDFASWWLPTNPFSYGFNHPASWFDTDVGAGQ